MRYMPAKMVFLHPRVIISACLLLHLVRPDVIFPFLDAADARYS